MRFVLCSSNQETNTHTEDFQWRSVKPETSSFSEFSEFRVNRIERKEEEEEKKMSWRRVLKSVQEVVAHGLLFTVTLLLVLKLDHVVSYSWWSVHFLLFFLLFAFAFDFDFD